MKLNQSLKQEYTTAFISITVAASITYTCLKYISAKLNKVNKYGFKEIPTPSPCYPYIGHFLSLGSLPSYKALEWHTQLGGILKIKMGIHDWLFVDDPILAHKIFVKNGVNASSRRYSIYSQILYTHNGLGLLFSQPGVVWKKNRTAALSLLSPKQIVNYSDYIDMESSELVERLIEATEKNGSVDPIKDLALSSFNVIFKVGFGKRFNSTDDPEYQKIGEIAEKSMRFTGLKNSMPDFLPIARFFINRAGILAKMKAFIENERDPILLGLIHHAMKQDGPNVVKSLGEEGIGMNEEEKLVFMSDMIAAGTDTISVTLAWTIAILCQHLETQMRVCEEIDDFIKANGRLPSFQDRDNVPFCISVMKECMRYRSTTPIGIPHTITKDIIVDDYFIPKGTVVCSSMDSMHRRVGGYYEDADKFKPDRFMNNIKTMQSAANGKLEERDHFNFGWGRRICPGIYLAETEIFTTLIHLFSKCIIQPVDESNYPNLKSARNGGATTLPSHYHVKFVKRVT